MIILPRRFRRRHRLLIRYKSGQSQIIRCESFTIKSTWEGPTSVEWENVWPKPLAPGASQIESVWQL